MGRFTVPVRSRYIAHGLVCFLAVAAALISSVSLTVVKSAPLGGEEAPAFVLAGAPPAAPTSYIRNPQLPPLVEEASPAQPQPRSQPVTYKVSPGDTVSNIAQEFGISPQTVVQTNDLKDENRLVVGEELTILPVSGVLHTVKKGDTLSAIAQTYKVAEADIVGYGLNGLADADSLQQGQKLIIPGGTPPAKAVIPPPAPRPAAPPAPPVSAPAPSPQPPKRGTGQFAWPTIGPITQYFNPPYHTGIDIAPPFGTPIYAADAGRVTRIEQLSWGYGWNLYIDHGNGYVTHYSHVSAFAVSVGDYVNRGQLVARVGSTGRSTGPHLDFEIYINGAVVNPLNYLP